MGLITDKPLTRRESNLLQAIAQVQVAITHLARADDVALVNDAIRLNGAIRRALYEEKLLR